MNPAVLITSHKDNTVALDHLLESLANCPGIEKLKIVIVAGGYHENEEYTVSQHPLGAVLIQSPYNSIDFTGLLAVLDIPDIMDHESYIYVHDTTRVGLHFVECVLGLAPGLKSASFKFPSMNMGLYSRDVIHASRDLLETFRNADPSREAAQKMKTRCVQMEDCIFRSHAEGHTFLSFEPPGVSSPVDYYGNGIPRIVEYYPALAVYKIKANWYTKSIYQLSL